LVVWLSGCVGNTELSSGANFLNLIMVFSVGKEKTAVRSVRVSEDSCSDEAYLDALNCNTLRATCHVVC
jgi:hypothetical protein